MPDNLTPEQRQKTMRAVKGRDTLLEKKVSSALHKKGLRFRRCLRTLPGKPDIVFTKAKVIVFVDGDFWHGWRFPEWRGKLTDYWQKKIERNRRRDRCNFQRLRRRGWMVLRFWSHQIERNLNDVVEQIETVVAEANSQARDESNGREESNRLRKRR